MICPYFPCGGFPSHGGTPESFYFWIFHEINHRAMGYTPFYGNLHVINQQRHVGYNINPIIFIDGNIYIYIV